MERVTCHGCAKWGVSKPATYHVTIGSTTTDECTDHAHYHKRQGAKLDVLVSQPLGRGY